MALIGPSFTKSSSKMFEISSSDSSEDDSDEEWRPKTSKSSSSAQKTPNSSLSFLLSSEISPAAKFSGHNSGDRKLARISSTVPTASLSKNEDDLFLIDKSTSEERNLALKNSDKSKLDDEKSAKKKKDEDFEEILLSSTLDDGEIEQKASSYIDFYRSDKKNGKNLANLPQNASLKVDNKRVEEIMKKSVITPEFHKKETVPTYYQSLKAQKKQRKLEREKTKGKDWFNMPATEMTEERKRDLEIMQIRDSFDTKTFYKKDDRKVLPKYFQIGTVIEDPTDFYSDRVPKKQRKQTIVEELLADADFQKYHKEKYKQIVMKKEKLKRRLRPKKTRSTKKK